MPSKTRSCLQAPLTRRQALPLFAGGLSAVFSLPSWGQAREQIPLDLAFIVVSDTHLGRMDSESPARQWAKTAAQIDAAKGDLVLHLGDIVDQGREAQYPIYLETRRTIKKPVHEIPGNHDPPELFRKHIRNPIDLSFDHKGVRFLLSGNAHVDSHDGFFTAEQIGWIGAQCDEAAKNDLRVILCAHVPVHTNTNPDRGWYVKPDQGQKELYNVLDRHRGRVLAMFHGHFHNGIRGWDDRAGLHEILFPSALYNQDRMLQAKRAPGYNLAEFRPGFVTVAIRGAEMTLRYQPVGAEPGVSKSCQLPEVRT